MSYIENPKTKGSGIVCVIPQSTKCPLECNECFFQSGRSYLEPLSENLPNMISVEDVRGRIVRVNDGNDSNCSKDLVIQSTSKYEYVFFNTSIPNLKFPGPVVLTINPDKMTDKSFYKIDYPPKHLMFVRIRTNSWNINEVVVPAVSFYTSRDVPVVLTFMAYHSEDIFEDDNVSKWKEDYIYTKRTLNSYWCMSSGVWKSIMNMFLFDPFVYSCGTVGELGNTLCKYCGNCLREYFATIERME